MAEARRPPELIRFLPGRTVTTVPSPIYLRSRFRNISVIISFIMTFSISGLISQPRYRTPFSPHAQPLLSARMHMLRLGPSPCLSCIKARMYLLASSVSKLNTIHSYHLNRSLHRSLCFSAYILALPSPALVLRDSSRWTCDLGNTLERAVVLITQRVPYYRRLGPRLYRT